jgi:murein DD-endopeptidase MepM/ murein hydrolase activator NlpD
MSHRTTTVLLATLIGAPPGRAPQPGSPRMIASSPTATAWRRRLLLAATLALLALGYAAGPVPAAAATPRSTSSSLSASPDTLVYGHSTTLTAKLSRTGTTEGIAGQRVRFDARRPGTTTWSSLGAATTDSNGRAVLTATPKRHTEYRAVFGGTADWEASRSKVRTVRVAVAVSSTMEASPIWLGRATHLSGAVRPAHPGQNVLLQRLTNDGWKLIDEQALTAESTYRFKIKPTRGGSTTYRVVKPADADHDRGRSARRGLTVRAYAFPVKPASAASYSRDHHDYPAADIFAPCGTSVVSPTAGTVHEVSRVDTWDPAVNSGPTRGGLSVSIIGRDGVRYYGSHFQRIESSIQPGAKVAARQLLGTVGRTGSARNTPCHLHFGISPPCGTGDWAVRRGVVWPWSYLDAWKGGTDRSPRAAVDAWEAANRSRCPR